jgi:hypothetical protein
MCIISDLKVNQNLYRGILGEISLFVKSRDRLAVYVDDFETFGNGKFCCFMWRLAGKNRPKVISKIAQKM